ncbi:DUF4974 domain-containing protein [Dyadobacter frigoris]|uniref:DUF4974 domain-containing protein n=1 Tax=Dyadobacter frigoris TaxID=2576211 RepID=UPI0035B64DBA
MENFNYKDVPLSVIVPQLEKAYGATIIYENNNLDNCSITADVSHFKDLFAQLDVLCAAIGASYQVKADQVVLSGIGCKVSN